MAELIYPQESYKIMGACFEVYKAMGCGFLEPVYQECLEIELGLQEILFQPQQDLQLTYKNRPLKQTFRPDFLCYGKIVVEIKAVDRLVDEFRAQVINYLHTTGFQLGLLVNFGHFPKVEYERFALTND